MKKPTLLLMAFIPLLMQAQQIKYVKSDATGNGDGSNWQNAFTTLTAALLDATYGDHIWVSKGIYLPTTGTDRNSTFLLPIGVSMWGGFSGSEISLAQRDVASNATILSGDIGIPAVRTDNVFHVVTILGGDNKTIVDGFLVMQGNADGIDEGGVLARDHGGGILIVADDFNPVVEPVVRNCRFEQNRGLRGGGIACLGNEQNVCVPEITGCFFSRNRGEVYGASIFKEGFNVPDRPFIIYNCQFERNYCQQMGGGVAIVNPSGIIQIRSCTFTSDTGRVDGGALFFETGQNKIRYEIDSCIFTANNSLSGCGGVTHFNGFSLDTIEVIIKKSYFFLNNNYVGSGGGFASYSYSKYNKIHFEDCLFESNISQNAGGGIYIDAGSGSYSETSVDRCFFLGNQTEAASFAGAFYFRGFGSSLIQSRCTITNSVFMFNTGSIASLGSIKSIHNTRVVNCSFYRNGENPFMKYWGVENNPIDLVMKMQFLNCIIWEPQAEGVKRVFFNNDPVNFSVNDYLVEHSIIHLSDCSYDGVNPCQEGMIYSTWPDFIDSSGQLGLIPEYGFPGLNKGSALVVDTFGLTKDFLGVNRIYCDSVDIGAYEVQGNCFSGIIEASLASLPGSIKILNNPVISGQDIMAEFFSPITSNFHLKLMNTVGNVIWQDRKITEASVPALISISTVNMPPGLYLLNITDKRGRTKVEKILLF